MYINLLVHSAFLLINEVVHLVDLPYMVSRLLFALRIFLCYRLLQLSVLVHRHFCHAARRMWSLKPQFFFEILRYLLSASFIEVFPFGELWDCIKILPKTKYTFWYNWDWGGFKNYSTSIVILDPLISAMLNNTFWHRDHYGSGLRKMFNPFNHEIVS